MTPPDERRRTVSVEGLARVEGEGSLRVEVRDGRVEDVELQIFEPPRFFEAFLRGRRATEAPDLTARICGICPVAYQMSACAAVEDALGMSVGPGIADLRRLLYCGEWMQSHSLHVHMLHAPDFLDCQDAVEMAQLHRPAFERGLALKKMGNRIMETVGGRAIHPVNVKVGGFYRAPSKAEVAGLAGPLSDALDKALATVEWVAGFDFPDVHGDYRFVALREPGRYPLESGRVASSDGLDTTPAGFADLVVEEHVARSTALHARIEDRLEYLTGPLARYALEFRQSCRTWPPRRRPGLAWVPSAPTPSRASSCGPSRSCSPAGRRSISWSATSRRTPRSATVPQGGGVGTGATEAPRGLLFHRYHIDPEGSITKAQIVPPTSQNQITIEADIRRTVQASLDLDDDELTWRSEQAVRNHDPCISCATHFLDVTVTRT